jgi:hypothetical protein
MKSLIAGALLLFAQSEVQNAVIRSLKYENFKVSPDDLAHRLKDRGIRVAVEQFYEPQQVEAARQAFQELLEEKGRHNPEVKAEVRQIPPHSVEVIFKAVKN